MSRYEAQDITISELRQKLEKAEHDAERYARKIEELTEENERLNTSCTELTQCCTKLETLYKVECKRVDTVKTDTVRKMQERVKAKILEINGNLCGLLPFIDQIAKEMIGDDY